MSERVGGLIGKSCERVLGLACLPAKYKASQGRTRRRDLIASARHSFCSVVDGNYIKYVIGIGECFDFSYNLLERKLVEAQTFKKCAIAIEGQRRRILMTFW